MSAFDPLLNAARWSLSVGARFVRHAPGATAVVVMATLVSQLAMLLAFFLPIKVVILLGSTGVPRYFPPAMAEMDRDALIIALGVAAVGVYLLHLFAERVIAWGSDFGAKRLLACGSKLVLFENQDEMAARGYRRYAHALASGIFVVLSGVALAWLYPAVALLSAVYVLMVIVALLVSGVVSARVGAILQTRLRSALSVSSMLGFLLAFAYMVADFLWGTPPSLIAALIAVLLLRQTFGRMGFMVNDIAGLYQQRIELNALFFNRQVLLPDHVREERGIWPLLVPQERETWVRPVLEEIAGIGSAPLSVRWHQHALGNVAALEVRDDTRVQGGYLLRLFDENRSVWALHEATLLAEMTGTALPAPRFLGATRVGNCHCHVFACDDFARVPSAEVTLSARRTMETLMAIEPPETLAQRYTGSRPCLWQRLDERVFMRLGLAADEEEQRQMLLALTEAWPYLRALLQDLPLVILNPDLNAETLLLGGDGENCVATWWGRWSLDPVGSAWSIQPKALDELDEALASAAQQRSALQSVSTAQARLAALLYALEQRFVAQQYVNALALLPQILALVAVDEPQSLVRGAAAV